MEGGPSIQDEESSNYLENSEENRNRCYFLCCHPHGIFHRFIALTFMCFLGFGSYFCYDNPAALIEHIQSDLNITSTQYNLLYSIYSWPNVVLCFVGGFLIDRIFGIRLGTSIYAGVTLLGQLCFAFGTYLNQYWMMIVGRFIFGIGGESLAVAQNNYAVLWFKGKELNMVFGFQMSFSRVGSYVNFNVMESVYDWVHKTYLGPTGLGFVLLIASSTCVLSLICALILGFLDRRAEIITNRRPIGGGDVVRLTDVKDFKVSFWLITVVCVTYYVTIFPFIANAKKFFMDEFHMDSDEADRVAGLVYLVSAFASPILGFLIDKCGKNILWIFAACVVTFVSHVMLGFTSVNPYATMVIMGLAYSTLASSLWPLVSLIIPEYQLGTAYGVCQAVQNLGLAVISIVTGVILENLGYISLEIFFLGSLILASASTILLWILDKKWEGTLNMTPGQRQCHQQRQLAADVMEREKIITVVDAMDGSTDPPAEQPHSDAYIRNRYLSRIGAEVSNEAKTSTSEEKYTQFL